MEAPSPSIEPIEGQLAVEEQDFVEAFLAQGKRNIGTVRKLMAFVLVVTGLLVLVNWPVTPGLWTLMIPAALFAIWMIPGQSRFLARRAFRLGHPAWRNVTLTLDEEHVRVSSDKCESYRPWSGFSGWLETDRLIVTLTNTSVADVWPKGTFATDDLPRVRQMLDTKIVLAEKNEPAPDPKKVRTGKIVLWVILVLLLLALYSFWRTGA